MTTPDREAAISHEEAREIMTRLVAGAFRRDGEHLEHDKRPRFSIPARASHDDDIRLAAYIEQQSRTPQAAREQHRELLEQALLDEAWRLLRIAFVALYRLRLIDRGHDCSLPHELREFALAFSEDDTSGKHGQFRSGSGAYRKWREEIRAPAAAPKPTGRE